MGALSESVGKNNKLVIQDFVFFGLIGAAAWYGGEFALAPTVDLKPLPVDSANLEITVGNKVAKILLPRGECKLDEKGNYTLIFDGNPKASVDGVNITSVLPSRNSGQYPNFLAAKFAGPSYNFGGLAGICDEYKHQLMGFIVNAVKMEVDSKASPKQSPP